MDKNDESDLITKDILKDNNIVYIKSETKKHQII